MKILFLTHYYPPEGNAPASRVSALAKRWTAEGHEVTVVTSAPNVPNGIVYEGYKNKWTSRETLDGVNVIRIWTWIAPNKGVFRRTLNFISYMWSAFFHCLFMKRPDVMIATSPQFFCGWAGVLLRWFRRFPFILEIRDIWPESMNAVNAGLSSGTQKILGWLEKIMYRTAGHIVTVGKGYQQKLQERGVPEEKISIVMNGVDQTMFYPSPPDETLLKQYGLEHKFICSYIGTIGMACGLQVVLQTAEMLKSENNDHIRFVLVGDGALREELENTAREKGLTNIIFAGRRPKEEIPVWLNSSSVSLIHLKKDPLFTTVMPSKIFESAGCSRPMIIGVEGFAEEIVMENNAGIPMESENARSLYDCVLRLSNDPELCAELGKNGFHGICAKYNRDQQAADYLKIIQNFITG